MFVKKATGRDDYIRFLKHIKMNPVYPYVSDSRGYIAEVKMKLLTRAEEMVLLAVWRLQDNAYCVPIREQLAETTNSKWSFGSVYDALDRLEKKGLLASYLSEPLKSRGGRSKRIYKHTREGLEALVEIRKIQDLMWDGISRPTIEKMI